MSFRRPARCARTATAPTRPRRSHPRPASTAAALSAVTSGTKIEWCCTSGLRCAQTILRQTMNGVPKRVPAAGLTASFSVRRRRGTCICAVLTATRSGRSLIAAKFRERHSIHSRDARAIAAIRSVCEQESEVVCGGVAGRDSRIGGCRSTGARSRASAGAGSSSCVRSARRFLRGSERRGVVSRWRLSPRFPNLHDRRSAAPPTSGFLACMATFFRAPNSSCVRRGELNSE